MNILKSRLLKTIIYRLGRIFILGVIGLFVTGSLNFAISISIIDMFIASIYYYVFDIIWDRYENNKN